MDHPMSNMKTKQDLKAARQLSKPYRVTNGALAGRWRGFVPAP